MAGGEFRLGTASIYMADYEHIRSQRTSVKCWITWLRFRPISGLVARAFNGLAVAGRRKLGLEAPSVHLYSGHAIRVPSLDDALPQFACSGTPRQPYRVVFVGEKSTLSAVLLPVARRIGGELLLPTGEASDTMIAELAARASGDGRPSVVLYFSDFDPAGHQMPISFARKLQALRDLEHHGLDIQVHPVALTLNQVRDFDLPSTPLKETERRADRWRLIQGHEQTEIDALAALRPDVLREIAERAIRPFFDETLEDRSESAEQTWQDQVDQQLRHDVRATEIRAKMNVALQRVDAAAEALHELQQQAEMEFARVSPPPFVMPTARIAQLAPKPLFSADDDYVTATRKLKFYKALDGVPQ